MELLVSALILYKDLIVSSYLLRVSVVGDCGDADIDCGQQTVSEPLGRPRVLVVAQLMIFVSEIFKFICIAVFWGSTISLCLDYL